MERARILIADTHRMFAEGLKALLMIRKNLGVPVVADSAERAFDILENGFYDLLLTNISLDSFSGIELTRMVKMRYPRLKVLVITRTEDQETYDRIMMAGAEGYISKHTHPDDFLLTVESLLFDYQPR